MGVLEPVVDSILIGFFLVVAIAGPTIHAQALVPEELFAGALVELKRWYAREYGDYVIAERPHFYIGLVWVDLLFQWPLSLFNLYAILSAKPWFGTTCLIFGVSVLTSVVAMLSEIIGSGRACDKLLYIRCPFLGLAILAILRGLSLQRASSASANTGEGASKSRKKQA